MSSDSSESVRNALDAGLAQIDARAPKPQRVVVIGGGLSGLSTAYWLSRAGNAVTVLESRPESAAPWSAASHTGLLSISSTFAPFFARPHLLKAQKIQFCPSTNYVHPNLRPSSLLFSRDTTHGAANVAQHIRQGMIEHAWRGGYRRAMTRLYGLGLWNQTLVSQLVGEWNRTASPKQPPIERTDGSLGLVFDMRAWEDIKVDVQTNTVLVGRDPALLQPEPTAASAIVPAPSGGKQSKLAAPRVPDRIASLEDDELLNALPSIAPNVLKVASALRFRDEFAVDPLAFTARMKSEAIKQGVQFKHDAQVVKLVTKGQQKDATTATARAAAGSTASSSSTAVAAVPSVSTDDCRIVGVQLASGAVVEGDAFVVCAGAHSTSLLRQSALPCLPQPIPTFSTKTHFLSFPNPGLVPVATAETNTIAARPSFATKKAAAPGAPQFAPLIAPIAVTLPESHLQVTPFSSSVRVTSGDDLNLLDDPKPTPSKLLSSQQQDAFSTAVDPDRLRMMLGDLNTLYPALSKSIISQDGRTEPGVALRNWSFDGKPLLGRYASSVPNLFVNTAHGNASWTHAVAAGQHVSNIVSELPTFIQPDAFDPKRFEGK